ncbi:uncharacterized protein B0J16DRAFT_108209 [Fusarium flagelliforme]|uniref:Uncharacterized protein n=1 Tax=Fusarium flagelliforme TaxID=2675880 RepID=A0A395MBX9_9HYPO|nr:uncharacterized protein B0J16DRAFT_108209 [Fusarium flagelliforme]KAH7189122.1 hypothetical protein B0J16DRAFT_108209 [Fusarium flagelliforme]RFN45368.1 hypothetical protein FIE12Z_10396 [Fusarium flagelliforme]
MSENSLPTSTVVAATQAEQVSPTISPFILAFNIIVAVFTWLFSFNWSAFFLRIFAIVSFPFRLILFPLSIVANVLLTIFAPVIYLFSYAAAGVRSVWLFLAGLEPLYTFFGAAAGVGIIAGITIAIFSSVITSYLGMQKDDALKGSGSKENLLETSSRRDSLSSDTDLGWQWLDSSSSRRRPTSGLLSQTIHEEDDDSEY